MMDVLGIINALGLSPVCAVVLIGAALLVLDRMRLIKRNAILVDRQLDDLTRRAALWDRARQEAEQ